MPTNREDKITSAQSTLLERASAVSRDQLDAALWALERSNVPEGLKDDPAVLAAAIQALSTNYLAEVLRARPLK